MEEKNIENTCNSGCSIDKNELEKSKEIKKDQIKNKKIVQK
jgi:hypothetical protein